MEKEVDYNQLWDCLLKFCLYGAVVRFDQVQDKLVEDQKAIEFEEQAETLLDIARIMKTMARNGINIEDFTEEKIKEKFKVI